MPSPRPIAIALLVTGACAAVPARTPEPARTVVDFETRIAPIPIVPVSIDGGPLQPFVLDTGATVTLLNAKAASPAPIKELAVGGLRFRDIHAQAAPFPPELKVAGILAVRDAFPGALVEIDGRELRLLLYRDLDAEGWREEVREPTHSVPLTWNDGVPAVEARVGDAPLTLLLDSGAGACALTPETLSKLGRAGAKEIRVPLSIGASQAFREQFFPLDGPLAGSVGYAWFIGRRAAITADRSTLLFTERR